ncbi:MAG TPA: ribonuclease HIII [Ktedonobacteraceae bacterium]|nr:ribonuclease HIII [Ktedonobacteraceae bacterium]
MVGNKLQTTVNAFREFVHSQGWTIIAEKEIAYGYQLVVTDGTAKTPVDLFTTGKALVQGKPSELQTAIKSWVYKPQLPNATPDKVTGIARIGSDESGKGDYFGPLVVAAVYVDEQTESQLLALGVRDSKLLPDNIILAQAEEIKQICRGQGTVLSYRPERYNELYKETANLNLLLAQAHTQVIASVQRKVACNLAIVDQFGDESLVRNALAKLGCTITVEQRPHAEDDIAVAAASVIARAEFVRIIQELSTSVGIHLPKGASDPKIVTVGREIVAKYGQSALAKVAKLHFKTTEVILQG